jgi:MFS family permease
MAPATDRDRTRGSGLGTRDSKDAEPFERRAASGESRATALLAQPWYWYYVLALLTICYVANVADRSQVLAASLQAIKREFNATDAQLGILSGLPFAIFYSFLGIPIAAWADRSSRRNVLAWSCALWSAATGACGLAVNFGMLFGARVMTAIGEAGGSPPSHSLISDYFPKLKRGTAFSIYALAVPIGTAIGAGVGGWGTQHIGWRQTFYLVGFPGVALALLVRLTVVEPPRGYADFPSTRPEPGRGTRSGQVDAQARTKAPPVFEVLDFMFRRSSFLHLSLAAGLHSVAWYASGAFNNAFFQRSHGMSASEAGYWISFFSIVGGVGTFAGGFLADKLSKSRGDRRWYLWVPGIATFLCVPFQFAAYLAGDMSFVLPTFGAMQFMAAVFFGPSFAMTQAIATLRMRSVATSLLLLTQTLIGQGIGPWLAGLISDQLRPSMGVASLRYSLVIVGLVNIWAAAHYMIGARTLRADLEGTERLST